MLIALNSVIRRYRDRLTAAVVAVALSGAVVAAHSAIGAGHMAPSYHMAMLHGAPGGQIDSSFDDIVLMCLAIAETAALGCIVLAMLSARRFTATTVRLTTAAPLTATRAVPPPLVQARAGPAVLQVFLR